MKPPPDFAAFRRNECLFCPAPCGWQHDEAAHADPIKVCPADLWPSMGPCSEAVAAPGDGRELRGLGDAVAVVAGPIGRALGLNPKRCGCMERIAWLNQKVPFSRGGRD